MDKKPISFIWQGISGRYGHWSDGLYWAMKEIEKTHTVSYHEPSDEIPEDSIVLYWEAPCTINGKDAHNYIRVKNLPNKKALLFAGGPIKKEWLEGFDHVFVESKINKDELDILDISNSTAFGVNADMFVPMDYPKVWDGIHQATCASWKRQWLGAETFKDKMLLVGRYQETDPYPFDQSKKLGATILPEQPYEQIVQLLNQSKCLVQTSEFWGGGQRATLEAMACNVPPIVMTDSPKNREYVEESGFGEVCEPSTPQIRQAFDRLQANPKNTGRDYVLGKWTHRHYAKALLDWVDLQ